MATTTVLAFYADAVWACHAILHEEHDCVTGLKSI